MLARNVVYMCNETGVDSDPISRSQTVSMIGTCVLDSLCDSIELRFGTSPFEWLSERARRLGFVSWPSRGSWNVCFELVHEGWT